MVIKHKVYEAMREILPNYPSGIRASELKRMISDRFPDALPHSIGAVFSTLTREYPKEFSAQKVKGKGTFYFSAQNDVTDEEGDNIAQVAQYKESDNTVIAEKGKYTLKHQVYEAMKEILPNYPSGIRSNELKSIISQKFPSELLHSIGSSMSIITDEHPKKFYKQKIKGEGVFYFLVQNDTTDEKGDNIAQVAQYKESDNRVIPEEGKYKEKDFYASFAKYLQYNDSDNDNEYYHLDECTKAIPVGGGSASQGKWGMPDVIGVLQPDYNDFVQFSDEIVSAEIKSEKSSNAIITAFGQACAYRLFSHKTYLVIPEPKDINHTNRIEKLCQIFGIGLVYFDPDQKPDVSIYNLKLPAQKHSPDMFYVNDIVRGDIADKLYGRKSRKRK